MLMLFTYLFVALYNTEYKTQRLDSLNNFIDCHAVYPENPVEYIWKAPSGVWDLPIGLVNDVLYDEEFVEQALADLESSKSVISTKIDIASPSFLKVDIISNRLLEPEPLLSAKGDEILQEVWDELLNDHP